MKQTDTVKRVIRAEGDIKKGELDISSPSVLNDCSRRLDGQDQVIRQHYDAQGPDRRAFY